jgi:hypothetical protein
VERKIKEVLDVLAGMLEKRVAELKRWTSEDAKQFKEWFDPLSEASAEDINNGRREVLARLIRIQEILKIVTDVTEERKKSGYEFPHSKDFFKPAYSKWFGIDKETGKPIWEAAHVLHKRVPADYRVYLTMTFFTGRDSNPQLAAVLAHEWSHFPFPSGLLLGSTERENEEGQPIISLENYPLKERFSTSYYLQQYLLGSKELWREPGRDDGPLSKNETATYREHIRRKYGQ